MNIVEPIRDPRKIAAIKNLLRGQERWRDLLLFTTGINTALRVSDLEGLRIGQLLDESGQPREYFRIHDRKTGKLNRVTLNQAIIDALDLYRKAYPDVETDQNNYLFFDLRTRDYTSHIGRKQIWLMISALCADVGLRGNYGTHTLRKTWGYQARKNGVGLTEIMHMLNHTSATQTRRYLGITDEEIDDIVRRLNL